jgi:hypothetical protein
MKDYIGDIVLMSFLCMLQLRAGRSKCNQKILLKDATTMKDLCLLINSTLKTSHFGADCNNGPG